MAKRKVTAKDRMQSQKEDWLKDDSSKELQEHYREDLLALKKWAKDEEACQERLIACLGWENKGKNSVFKCPGCHHTAARTRLKKEGKGEVRAYRLVFECTKCHKSPSPRSMTMMKGSSIRLGFWFLCIYAIGLMNGKVPWDYLNTQRVKFKSGDKKVNVLGRDLERLILTILKTCESHRKRITYTQLVKLTLHENTPQKSYLSWYKSKSWVPWRIAYKKDLYTLKMVLACTHNTHSITEVESAFVCNDLKLYPGEWLLLAKVGSNEEIGNVEWLYVSQLYNISDENMNSDGYQKIALFLKKDKNDNYPFEIGKKIKNALGRNDELKFIKSLSLNSVEIPSSKIFSL